MTETTAAHVTGSVDLRGRVALVTGGSRGLGAEMATAFAAAGADLIIASRKQDACERLAADLRDQHGGTAIGIGAHVGHWDGCRDLVNAAYEALGRVDVLVNNAGIAPLYDDLGDVSEELFDKVLDVNLKGPFRLSTLIAPRMREAGAGSIINISSIASVRPKTTDLVYAAAKAGLNTLTRGMAQAYGPHVRVNTILAGPYLTDISRSWDMEAFEQRAQQFPLRRAGQPHEIVGAALYFAGDGSSFATGATLAVDGGRTAMP